jgi:hypothetical protein
MMSAVMVCTVSLPSASKRLAFSSERSLATEDLLDQRHRLGIGGEVLAIVDLSHALGLEVVAEGVETWEIQDAVGAVGAIHARLQILANAGSESTMKALEAVVIEGIAAFSLVAKYQARVHDPTLVPCLARCLE